MAQNELLKSLLPIILLNGISLISLVIFRFIYRRRRKDTTVKEFSHKTFVGVFLREFGYWCTTPFIFIFIKLKLKPNTLTISTPFLAVLAGYFYYKGNFATAGWILIFGQILDALDGRLARATNQATKEGAFLDSTLDRYSDGILFGSLAIYFRGDLYMLLITIMAIIGAEVTSYSKARGEVYGIETSIGLMQRAERLVVLGTFSIFHPFIMIILLRYGITTEYPIIIALVLLAVLTNYTAIIRIIYIFKEIRKHSED